MIRWRHSGLRSACVTFDASRACLPSIPISCRHFVTADPRGNEWGHNVYREWPPI